ncbi:hypothetical protein AG1IA_09282 [Rhizoctonia solani AG-1 IA]|uniref:Uncharacterized protein n=1 Tax=Thanatephorus cucumeris (strain AG1-IA) TaxID=983506 RepID=L8WIW3_THACA|nr:hypothetical protein AG1IA_09282 [Rhizoctonia solani AG-1 IA]
MKQTRERVPPAHPYCFAARRSSPSLTGLGIVADNDKWEMPWYKCFFTLLSLEPR